MSPMIEQAALFVIFDGDHGFYLQLIEITGVFYHKLRSLSSEKSEKYENNRVV
jgi:hypothetical protein